LVDANTVKQQAVTLTFQPQAYRTYVSPTSHDHTGDTHSIHSHSIVTVSLSHGNTGNEVSGHFHRTTVPAGTVVEGIGFDNVQAFRVASGGPTRTWNSDLDTALGSNDHGHAGSTTHVTHDHSYVNQTSAPNSNTGATATPTGVQEGTSPDAMRVLVDGTDVTTQLGGPFTTSQVELDITPYVAAGTGLHMVQVTTATNLGRISGFLGLKSIVNNMALM
jgi:hypothetical protein